MKRTSAKVDCLRKLLQVPEHGAWFRAEIEAGLREAEAKDFLTPEEKTAAYKRWTTNGVTPSAPGRRGRRR